MATITVANKKHHLETRTLNLNPPGLCECWSARLPPSQEQCGKPPLLAVATCNIQKID